MAARKKIYLSYTKRDDSGAVDLLRRALAAAGHDAVGDWELKPGDKWAEELDAKLNEADGAIIVVGREALSSEYMTQVEGPSLIARTKGPAAFRVVVLLLPGTDRSELRDSSFRTLADTYIPFGQTVEERITEVVAAFGPAPADEPSAASTEVAADPVMFIPVASLDVGAEVVALATEAVDGVPTLVLGSEDAAVRISRLDLSKALTFTLLHRSQGPVRHVARHAPYTLMAGVDSVIRYWDSAVRQRQLVGHVTEVTALAAGTVNGRAIAVSAADNDTLRVWDLAAGTELAALDGHEWANCLALGTVAGTPVVVGAGTDGALRVWNLETYELTMTLRGHRGLVRSVAVAAVGGRPMAASGGVDRTVRVWDLQTGEQVAEFTAHATGVRCVTIVIVDGRGVIVSCGNDENTIHLWDMAGNAIGEPLKEHTGPVPALVVTDLDGMPGVVSGSDDGTVRVWAAVRGDQVEWQSDATSSVDFLKRRPLALVLAQRLQRHHEKHPSASFLVHVDGPWGAGKSTLIDYVKEELEQRNWVPVEFDAWRESGVGPPWWALLAALRTGICRSRGFFGRFWLRTSEAWTRLRRAGASVVLGIALLLAVPAVVFFLLKPATVDAKSVTELAKMVTAVLAAVGTLGGGAFVAARLLLWDSARGARLFEQSNANPMQDVARHFHWLMKKAKAPVVFFIDDLDRCPQAYVVELLDAVQTIVRSKKGVTTDAAASFVVAADGAWLRASYEIEYEKFVPTIAEPGRPLGYLFLDKLFQLRVPVPMIDPPKQRTFLGHLLGLRTAEHAAAEEKAVRERLRSSTSEAHILQTLQQASTEVRDRVASAAVEKLAAPEVVAATEHQLHKFGPLLSPNPRSMKLFLNAYSMLRTVRTLEGNPVPVETLALWTVIETRWPRLADHLRTKPEHVSLVGKAEDELKAVPEDVRSLFADPAVHLLVTFQAGLTATAIRNCCGGQAS